jgi:hypothetical protein
MFRPLAHRTEHREEPIWESNLKPEAHWLWMIPRSLVSGFFVCVCGEEHAPEQEQSRAERSVPSRTGSEIPSFS